MDGDINKWLAAMRAIGPVVAGKETSSCSSTSATKDVDPAAPKEDIKFSTNTFEFNSWLQQELARVAEITTGEEEDEGPISDSDGDIAEEIIGGEEELNYDDDSGENETGRLDPNLFFLFLSIFQY